MGLEVVAIGISALLMSGLITGFMRRVALSRGFVDVPNQRSSHQTPTPRGGGASIVIAATAALPILTWLGAAPVGLLLALAGGGIVVAVVGFLDDRRRVSVGARFAIHVAAAIWAVACLGGLAPLRVGDHVITFGWSGYVLGALGIVWVLNLFNFMDGIDGIAASEATFVALCGAMFTAAASVSSGVAAAALVLGASCLGFLRWNWPPASIFMGDVGSGFLGYVIAVLALAAARQNPVALWVWLILGGVFFVDATVTLLRRLIRGDRVYEAHRCHAYQWLARRWGSHRRVMVAVLLINFLWLFPCALLATLRPAYAAVTTVLALAPLVALAVAAGAGRSEPPIASSS